MIKFFRKIISSSKYLEKLNFYVYWVVHKVTLSLTGICHIVSYNNNKIQKTTLPFYTLVTSP